jgi:hypothetical protein
VEVERARQDLEARTLSKIQGDFARLIYLASTRDYNSGEYYHAGLARQFTESAAHMALCSCHQDVFRRLVLRSVEELVEELQIYIRSTKLPVGDVVRAWGRLQSYRVTIPLKCDRLTARFFSANVTAALAVLQSREKLARPDGRPSSSPPQ